MIVEPLSHGHHFSRYLDSILRFGVENRHDIVVLTSPSALKSVQGQTLCSRFPSVEFIPIIADYSSLGSGPFLSLVDQYSNYRKTFKGIKKFFLQAGDKVILLHLDYLFVFLALLGTKGVKVHTGLWINVKFHWYDCDIDGMSWFRSRVMRAIFNFLVRQKTLSRILYIDALLQNFIKTRKAVFLPEYIANSKARSSDTQFDIGGDYILVFGSITERKCISVLLRNIKKISNQGYLVVLAGTIDLSVETYNEICGNPHFVIIDSHISEGLKAKLFENAALVWCVHRAGSSGSSGVFFDALGFRVPPVVRRNGYLDRLLSAYGDPITIDDDWEGDLPKAEKLVIAKEVFERLPIADEVSFARQVLGIEE